MNHERHAPDPQSAKELEFALNAPKWIWDLYNNDYDKFLKVYHAETGAYTMPEVLANILHENT